MDVKAAELMVVNPTNQGEYIIPPDAMLRGTFEASKQHKRVSFDKAISGDGPHSTRDAAQTRREKWQEAQRGGTMDRRRNQLGAIPHELYRHSREVEANAIRNDCRFHELEASDLPVGVLLTAIQPSSLGTVGCAFAGVSEWSTTGINTKPAGSCYSLNEPNHRTSCDTPQAATATELRAKCERLTRDHVTRRVDSELIEVLKILGTFDEIVDKTMAIIESKNDTEDAVLPVNEWVDKIIEVTLDSGACDHILDLSDAPGYANFLGESPGSKRGQ